MNQEDRLYLQSAEKHSWKAGLTSWTRPKNRSGVARATSTQAAIRILHNSVLKNENLVQMPVINQPE
jgi:hypothetical protein